MRKTRFAALGFIFALAASCATAPPERVGESSARWAANGWLTPGRSGDAEIIGFYATRGDCEQAVDDWMSRQVVGNPIHGECLPIDRH